MSHAINKAKALLLRKERKNGKEMSHAIIKANPLLLIQKEGDEKPYRSKLVVCIDILCNLVSNGPMKFIQLSHKVELDAIRLIPHLKLLMNRGLLEQQNLGENEVFYVITARGLKVLKVVSPIIKEAHKIKLRDFITISNTLSEAGYS